MLEHLSRNDLGIGRLKVPEYITTEWLNMPSYLTGIVANTGKLKVLEYQKVNEA